MMRRKALQKREMTLKKGTWSLEEDDKLIAYIDKYKIWNWNEMAKAAGLSRSGKSCRLRWMNYLRPNLKHGNFTKEEEDTIFKLQEELGNRWSLIAAQLPGRTDNDIKNFWNTHFRKRFNLKKNKEASSSKLQETEACGLVQPNPAIAQNSAENLKNIQNLSMSNSSAENDLLISTFQTMSLYERGESSFSSDGVGEIMDYGKINIEQSSLLGDCILPNSFCDDSHDHSLLFTVETQDNDEDNINLSEIFREIESFNRQKFPTENEDPTPLCYDESHQIVKNTELIEESSFW